MTESKAKDTSRANKPLKSATKPKSPPKPGAKVKPGEEAKHATGKVASRLIDERIRSLGGWRAETLAEVRRIIHEADLDIMEEWKWMGTPVWSRAGNICTGEAYKQVIKLTFARGASLEDPRGLFNSSLEGNTRRAIDIREGEVLDAEAFKALVQAAVAENLRSSTPKSKSLPKPGAKKAKPGAKEAKPIKGRNGEEVILLSGGNPKIAKADGDAPVQAYIAAMPSWKSDLGKRLDALIVRTIPNVRKAVKWNSPFYGIEGQGWFLSFHVLTRYVKVTFFCGTSLRPVPPGGTVRSKDARWIDIHEGDELDEAQMATWVKQAAALPGWVP
ncbi:hypothetical protein Sinac_6907 [Singulisphaera acidiphila DSM 18658]|uniref:YdhG-like domain-containing protein n=2 Tax=Singulisphaera acidiphila TaxID=466153 RepID=L0DNL9_SINAD|nr:hypothetical protein Sinac_6907 [Singulisphaera acidiphila DSM 18658]